MKRVWAWGEGAWNGEKLLSPVFAISLNNALVSLLWLGLNNAQARSQDFLRVGAIS